MPRKRQRATNRPAAREPTAPNATAITIATTVGVHASACRRSLKAELQQSQPPLHDRSRTSQDSARVRLLAARAALRAAGTIERRQIRVKGSDQALSASSSGELLSAFPLGAAAGGRRAGL